MVDLQVDLDCGDAATKVTNSINRVQRYQKEVCLHLDQNDIEKPSSHKFGFKRQSLELSIP